MHIQIVQDALRMAWFKRHPSPLFGSLKVERLHSTLAHVSLVRFEQDWLAAQANS